MSQIVLPNTIDAGTEIVASEHQQNYVAIRDIVNGQLEGGGGVGNNLKADGITAREIVDAMMVAGMPPYGAREGLVTQPTGSAQALYVSPGAGLVLNYGAGTAWVRDDSGVIASGALIPVTVTSGNVTVPSNSSGNPRLDQIILTMSSYGVGSVSVLQGTANVATTLNNRTGAAALPNNAILLADVLTTNGFAGPYTDHTNLRNRTPWAVPMKFTLSAASSLDFVIDSQTNEVIDIQHQVVTSTVTNLNWQAEGFTTSYGSVADEVTLLNTSALSRTARGGWNATGGSLNLSPAIVVAGGLKYEGRGMLSTRTTGSNWLSFTGDAAASSLTGSASHVLSDYHIAATLAPGSGGIYSWVHVFLSPGTMDGEIIVDRVPMS